GELTEEREHGAPVACVERAGRLVCEEHLGLRDQRPRNRDALLLSAGQLRRIVTQALAEADALCGRAHVGAPRAAAVEAQGESDVLSNRQRRHQVERLEDEADALAAEE